MFRTEHLASTISLVLGIVALVAGVASFAQPSASHDGLDFGPVIILSAIASHLATSRRTNPNANVPLAIVFEVLCAGALLLLWLGNQRLKYDLGTDPFAYGLIPIWALAAYLVAFFRAIGGGRIRCPHCAERIRREALVCRFCGRDVERTGVQSGRMAGRSSVV